MSVRGLLFFGVLDQSMLASAPPACGSASDTWAEGIDASAHLTRNRIDGWLFRGRGRRAPIDRDRRRMRGWHAKAKAV